MTTTNTCPECGGSLPPDAPGGACPRCLLAAGLDDEVPAGGDRELELESDEPGEEPVSQPAPRHPPPPPVEEIAPHFPTFELEELIGAGGMGIVYRGRQTGLDRPVALKVLWPELAADPAFAERFTREARAMARLDHPNIVRIYEFGERDGYYFLAMEFVDGRNLRELMTAGAIEPEQALAIVPQICDALQYAHDQGVVHRDIKPANVLVDNGGRVRIADFGLAKLVEGEDHTLTRAGQVMGTLHYMAPEQYKTPDTVDHRADIYSLGVVFYEMLTGDVPIGRFQAPSKKVHVDVRLDGIVLRSLEREPEMRYQKASDVATAVTSVSAVDAASATPVTPPPVTPPPAAATGTSANADTAAQRSELSILAVIAFLLVVPQLTFGMLGFSEPGFFVASFATAVVTTILGIAAWIRIGMSNGRLHGHLFAAGATILPMALGCVGTLLGLVVGGARAAQHGLDNAGPIYVGPEGVRMGEMIIDDDGVHFGEWIDITDDGVRVSEPLEIGERGIRPIPTAPPPQPIEDPDGIHILFKSDDRAAFVTGGPPWMENDDRASRVATLGRTWSELKQVRREFEATRYSMGRFYRVRDHRALLDMAEDEYQVRLETGDLGLPLLPIDRNVNDALHDFDLEHIELDESGEALVARARSDTTTLRFRMIRDGNLWKFEVAAVERMQRASEPR